MEQSTGEHGEAKHSDAATLLNTLRNGLWTVFGLWMGVVLYYRFMDPPAPRFVAIVTLVIAGAAIVVWMAEWMARKRSQSA